MNFDGSAPWQDHCWREHEERGIRRVLRLVTPPTARAVSIDEFRRHQRLGDDLSSDGLLALYLEAAERQLSYLGVAAAPATYALDLHRFPYGASYYPTHLPGISDWDVIELPMPPLRTITAIRATAPDGTVTTLDPSLYRVTIPYEGKGSVRSVWGNGWPAVRGDMGSASIEFTAGYDSVPGNLRAAIMLLAGSMFENRSALSATPMQVLPIGVADLVGPLHASVGIS